MCFVSKTLILSEVEGRALKAPHPKHLCPLRQRRFSCIGGAYQSDAERGGQPILRSQQPRR